MKKLPSMADTSSLDEMKPWLYSMSPILAESARKEKKMISTDIERPKPKAMTVTKPRFSRSKPGIRRKST